MKILLINNASLTPVENKLYCEPKTGSFAKELQELGNVITMFGQIVENNNIHTFDIQGNSIKTYGVKRKKNKFLNYINLYTQIIPNIYKSDFVYIFYPTAFKYTAILCFILRTPYGVYIRGENGIKSNFSVWLYKKSYVVFTVTARFTKLVKNLAKKKDVYSIRPMINFDENDININRAYQTPKTFKILYLGRVEEDKGIRELLEAISQMKRKSYSITLTLVGDGSFLPRALILIKELDINDIVLVKGAIMDSLEVKKLYLEADLYILPTYHEGFPRTLYEAMIFGVPIITTFVGGISGVMLDKKNCVQIQPKSSKDIIESIEYAINNYNQMILYAKNAFDTVSIIIDSSKPSHAEQLHRVISKINI